MDTLAILKNIKGGKEATKAELTRYLADEMGIKANDNWNKMTMWTKIFGAENNIPPEVVDYIKDQATAMVDRRFGKKNVSPDPVNVDEDAGKALYREYIIISDDERPRWLSSLSPEERVAMMFNAPGIVATRIILLDMEENQPFLAEEMFEVMAHDQRRESYTGPRTAKGVVAPIRVQVELALDPKDKFPAQLISQGRLDLVKRGVVVSLDWGHYNALKDGVWFQSVPTGRKDDYNMPIYEEVRVQTYPYSVKGMTMPEGYGFQDETYVEEEEKIEPRLEEVL
jgi:hypothetical protein